MFSCYCLPRRSHRSLLGSLFLLSVLMAAVPDAYAQESGWAVNPSDYEHTMSATIAVTLDGQPTPNAELGAFVNGEVRGTATATEGAGSDGQALHFLTIYGDVESDSIELALYHPESDSVYTTNTSFPFEINGVVGSPANPFEAIFGAGSLPDVEDWDVDPSAYEHTMSLTATVHVEATGQPAEFSDDRLAAFSPAGTVRGVAEPQAVGDAHLFFLTVYGNASDAGRILQMHFYDTVTDAVYPIQETLEFEVNGVEGNPTEPVDLIAVGDAPNDGPSITVGPEAINFEEVETGASSTETLTIENTGSAPLEGAVTLSDENDVFALTGGEGDFTVAPGETKEVEVTFAPNDAGSFEGTVMISHNAGNAPDPVEVALTGDGLAPSITVDPAAIDFDGVETGASSTETLTIENTGSAPLEGEVTLSDENDVFALTGGEGDFTVAPGETKEVEVTFAPNDAGSFEGTVMISHNAGNAPDPVEVALTSDGLAPAIAINPETVDFESIVAGESATETFTIENTGSAPLEGEVGLSEESNAFTLTDGAGAFTVASGEVQEIEVTFAPDEATSFRSTLAINHNGGNAPNPVDVGLIGEAIPADPVITQELADTALASGAAATTWDLTQYVESPSTSPGPLTFSASSSASSIVTAEVAGSTLRVTPVAVGIVSIEVTAETEAGGTATLDFVADVNALSVTATRSFGDPRSASSYRLVGLPGQVDEDVSATLYGEAGNTWRVFRETGIESDDTDDYLQAYDGSEAFRFAPGRGFWMLSREDWAVDITVAAIELTDDSSTTVQLQDGWNILSNPLDQPVDWEATRSLTANDGLTETLWQWDGNWSEADLLESAQEGDAYYLFNDGGLDVLTLQHPAATGADETPAIASTLGNVESLQFTAVLAPGPDEDGATQPEIDLGTVVVGRASAAYMARQPPSHFMPAAFYVASSDEATSDGLPDETTALSRLLKAGSGEAATDALEGLAFDLRLETTRDDRTESAVTERTAHVILREALSKDQFVGEEALLITPDGSRHDLRSMEAASPIDVLITNEPAELRVLIGSEAFIDEELQVPESLTFGPVYPNPSRGLVTIEVGMSETADAEIALYDMLGRRVATLHSGELPRGLNELQWTGDNLASGMYFLRLRSGGDVFTEKVVRVR